MRSLVVFAVLLVWAGPAAAAEGVTEINQARALAGGVTAGDTAGFPVTITGPGSYVLTSNLEVGDGNTSAILISGNEITIDLNGFALIGPNTCSGAGSALSCTANGTGLGISGSASDFVTVRDGQIRGFGSYGIRLDDYSRLEAITLRENGGHGALLGDGALVSDCTAERNNGDGFNAAHYASFLDGATRANKESGFEGDQGSIYLGNLAYDNGGDGISALFGTNVLHDNEAYQNELNGMRASAGGILTRNVAADNGDNGFFLNATAGYSMNVVYRLSGTGTTVSGGVNLLNNRCNNAGVISACP